MPRFLPGALALCTLLSSTVGLVVPARALAAPPTRKEMVRRVLPHNVRLLVVEDDKVQRTASGVVVASEASKREGGVSYVLTNAHAVAEVGPGAAQLRVAVDDRGEVTEYAAEVLVLGEVPHMDLALVRVSGVRLPAARLAGDTEPELGDDVVVVGAPFGRALSLSGGMVSQLEWDRATKRPTMLKTDAPIGYGASGGGIFSLSTGRLLAIVEGYRTATVDFAVAQQSYSFDVPMPGETFAAPSAKVRTFLSQKGYARLLAGPPRGARPRPGSDEGSATAAAR
jgi:serine protease Do